MSSDDLVKLAALYRHWIIADSVRAVLRQKASTPEQEARTNKEFGIEYVAFGEHASMICRMQVWYSLLYVVVEGYRELGQKYEPLEEVLAKGEFADLLRRYGFRAMQRDRPCLRDSLKTPQLLRFAGFFVSFLCSPQSAAFG